MIINYYKESYTDRLTKTKKREGSWVYVENPDHEDISKLAKTYKLDPALIRDALDPFEAPRMEVEDSVTYIFATIPHKEGFGATSVPVLITIGPDFITTVSRRELPFMDKFKSGKIEFNTLRKTKLLTQFLKEIITLYNSYLLDINKQVRRTSIYPGKISEEDIALFVKHEEVLNTFISDLHPLEGNLKSILTGKYVRLTEDDSELIEDIMLSTLQLIDTCRLTLTNIVNIRGAYATIVTNNLNKIIKILTVLTIILTIPTIIGSFYGMNVRLPLENHPNAFWIITGGTVVVSMIVLYLLKKKEWL